MYSIILLPREENTSQHDAEAQNHDSQAVAASEATEQERTQQRDLKVGGAILCLEVLAMCAAESMCIYSNHHADDICISSNDGAENSQVVIQYGAIGFDDFINDMVKALNSSVLKNCTGTLVPAWESEVFPNRNNPLVSSLVSVGTFSATPGPNQNQLIAQTTSYLSGNTTNTLISVIAALGVTLIGIILLCRGFRQRNVTIEVLGDDEQQVPANSP